MTGVATVLCIPCLLSEHLLNSFPLPFQLDLDVWLGFLAEHHETIALKLLTLQSLPYSG